MKIPLIDHAFKLASRWIDDTVPVKRLHEFISEHVFALTQLVEDDAAGGEPPRVLTDSRRTRELAAVLGFLTATPEAFTGKAAGVLPRPVALPEGLDIWRASLPDGMVVSKGVLAPQTGWFLDSIDSLEEQSTDFVRGNIERLLRHVEIRRNRSIEKFTSPLTEDDVRLERHDVAILFARHSLRSRDIRMLNAAFKLNDWSFPLYAKGGLAAGLSRYLLALLEQEYSARELLTI